MGKSNQPLNVERILWAILTVLVAIIHLQEPLQRQFIKYDDHFFVEPMLQLSLKEYFTQWLPDRALLGFPVRDLLYLAQHHFGQWLGYNIIGIVSVVFFLVTTFLFSRILQLLTDNAYLRWSTLFLWASHPLLVETLQWIWIQKLILAYMFILLASYMVFARLREGKSFTSRDWLQSGILWLLSIGCWPTTVLWPIFPLIVFWPQMKPLQKRVLIGLFSVAIMSYLTIITGGSERDYRVAGHSVFNNWTRTYDFGVNSLGRAFFNFIFPYRLAMYYDLSSPLNKLGLIVACFTIGFVVWAWRKNIYAAADKKLLILSGLLFAPQCLPFLGYSNFIWADRYMYVVLPMIIYILLKPMGQSIGRRGILAAIVLVTLTYSYISYGRAPLWREDLKLTEECAANEKSTYCEFLELEKKFDRVGCAQAYFVAEKLSSHYSRYNNPYDFVMHYELPFYHSMCLSRAQGVDLQSALNEVDALKEKYPDNPHANFGKILLLAQSGEFNQAVGVIEEVFEQSRFVSMMSTTKLQQIYAGLIFRICELSKTAQCIELRDQFMRANRLDPRNLGSAGFSFGYLILSSPEK